MAYPLIANDILKTTCVCHYGDQTALMTVHYRVASVGAPPITDKDVADAMDTALSSFYKPLMHASATYKGFLVQRIWLTPVTTAVEATANAGIGTAGADPLPSQVTGVLSWYTDVAGRKGRGRIYPPFLAAASVDTDDTPVAGYVTALDNLATAYRALGVITVSGRTGVIVPIIWHRTTHLSNDITQQKAHKKYGTQRRRGNYGRPNLSPI